MVQRLIECMSTDTIWAAIVHGFLRQQRTTKNYQESKLYIQGYNSFGGYGIKHSGGVLVA